MEIKVKISLMGHQRFRTGLHYKGVCSIELGNRSSLVSLGPAGEFSIIKRAVCIILAVSITTDSTVP